MNNLEQTKLRAVLPAHLIYSPTSVEGPNIYDTTTENVTLLHKCTTARECISALVHEARALGRMEGKSDTQLAVKKVLGIPEDINQAVHAALR